MASNFINIKSDFIPILDWTLIRNISDKKELLETYRIENGFEIIGTDITGDIIVEKDSKLYLINHEQPKSEALFIVSDIPKLEKVLIRIINIPEYSVGTPIAKLKEIKKELTSIKNDIAKGLKGNIEEIIDDVKELISDSKFYQTNEGKRYLITESFKENFYTKIQRPKRYRRIEVERDFESEFIKIIGVCEKEDESKEELKKMLQQINCELPIEFGQVYTFEEYKIALKNKQ